MIKEYFPYSSPRKGQCAAIENILEALESYDYCILDASTGFGKTAVARTILEYKATEEYQDSYLLTSTKMLQEQYYNECKNNNHLVNYRIAKGRGNFSCKEYNNLVNCNLGACQEDTTEKFQCEYGLKSPDPRNNGGCNYWQQKSEAIMSDVAIMNYDVILSDFPNHYKKRDMMLLDEAHNIDNKVMQRVGLTLSSQRLKKLLDYEFDNQDYNESNIQYWIHILNDINHELREHIVNSELYNHNKRQMDQIKRLEDKITTRLKEINYDPSFWFVYPNKIEEKIIIKPLDVSGYVKPMLLDKANQHLFMSGSIINPPNFIKYLGLDEDEVYYYKAESSFNMKENNPLLEKYCGPLTYKQKEKTLPKTYVAILDILEKHKNQKGIIHCNSRDFRNKILYNVNSSRFITYENSEEKDEILEYFRESDSDDVIVAYSLEEGVDLPYDNIQFQIIFKVPYPFLGDPQVKARKDADADWYMTETIRKIVQILGRGMRAEDDSCTNYILDSSFKGILRNRLCPTELKECVQ